MSKLRSLLLAPVRGIVWLHKRVYHPPESRAESIFTHTLGWILSLAFGVLISYFHATTLALPAWIWVSAGIVGVAQTYLLVFPALYLLLLKPLYRLLRRIA